MILVSINGDVVRRYDTSRDEGLTHVGVIVRGEDYVDLEALVESFRVNPPAPLEEAV